MSPVKLNARRRALLSEMGVAVWRLRDQHSADAATAEGPYPEATLPELDVEPSAATTASAPAAAPTTDSAATVTPAVRSAAVPSAPRVAAAQQISAPLNLQSADWQSLNSQIRACTRCGLHESRTQAVCGVGDEAADWLIVGEAPGADEDVKGEPFVGRAGQLLNEMLGAIGLQREQVYIGNVLKCLPPGSRNPNAAEIAECRPYLDRQIELLQPKMILVVGAVAARTLLDVDTKVAIARLRGTVHRYGAQKSGADSKPGIPLVVTYHPAYLLRKPVEKRKSWEDLCLARAALSEQQS